MKPIWTSLFAGLAIWLGSGADVQAEKLKVLTSFLPVYCFTVNVAGDLAEVENLLPPGVGPHDYQFTPKDRRKLAKADLIVINGLGMESWLERALQAGDHKPVVVEISAGLNKELLHSAEPEGKESEAGHHHELNPHVWLDPLLAVHAVTNILVALQKADPAHAAGYARNAEGFVQRLEKLDAEIREGLTPVRTNSFVTFHDAFPYFIRRYQLNLAGVLEETPEVSPSPRYLAQLSGNIRQRKARAIFVEPQFPSTLAEQLAKDLKIKIGTLDTMEIGPQTPSAYEEIMRRNLRVLQETLK